MKILKFGGTSLGSAERIRIAANIARTNNDCIVVCSAMSGMTNSLLEVADTWQTSDNDQAAFLMKQIQNTFDGHCRDLFQGDDILLHTEKLFQQACDLLEKPYEPNLRSMIPALGEQLTSLVFQMYLYATGTVSVLLDATEIVRLNENDEPDPADIARRLQRNPLFSPRGVFVTQGFICRDHQGRIATLSRGGSDFTATLLGAAIQAELIEIWTDIDGMHNNDPRHVQGTSPISELSYSEAAELAYFGAKILHPSCVRPARENNVPICIKNTFDSNAPGTTIQAETPSAGIRAIAAKDQINILRITSGRMFNAYGFLAKVFEIFSKHRVPVDVVTTSEVSVSVTIEDPDAIDDLVTDLKQLGTVDIERDRCILCVVGDVLQPGHFASIMQYLKEFNIRMVSLGASSNNITFVLPIDQKKSALNALHPIFNNATQNTLASYA